MLIPDRDRTIPAERGFCQVIQVSAKVLNKIVRPSHACFVQGWVENGELFRIACDLEAAVKIGGQLPFRKEKGDEGTYCSSVANIEFVIVTQGSNSYNHAFSQP